MLQHDRNPLSKQDRQTTAWITGPAIVTAASAKPLAVLAEAKLGGSCGILHDTEATPVERNVGRQGFLRLAV